MKVSVNGKILKDNEAGLIPAEGVFHGVGLFETVRLQDGHPLRWEAHCQRLAAGCSILGLPLPPDTKLWRQQAEALSLAAKMPDGALRLTWSKRRDTADLILSIRPFPYSAEAWDRGFKLGVSPWQRNPGSPTAGLKTCSYVDNLLIRREAESRGFDEAILLTPDGHLCEGSFTNLFFTAGGVICTPDFTCGPLPGIMRAEVLKLADRLGFEILEGRFTMDTLRAAEEIFVTNALVGIMPVFHLEKHSLPKHNPVTTDLMRAMAETDDATPC
jgi:4-amino-4-deoxychorismate lyase